LTQNNLCGTSSSLSLSGTFRRFKLEFNTSIFLSPALIIDSKATRSYSKS